MRNFQAKTKEELHDNQPPNLPQPECEPLCKMADGTDMNHYYFRGKAVTVDEVSAPGFFNFMRENFRSGRQKSVVHMVTCQLGEVTEGLIEVDLHLVDAPSAFSGPVVMAVGPVKHYKPQLKPA